MEIETTKEELENINIPDGYVIVKDPELVEKERIAGIKAEIEKRLSEMTIPTDEELIEYGKLSHPYYYQLKQLEELNG